MPRPEHAHELAVRNAMELWRRLGRARGCSVVRTPRYLVVEGTADQGGLRVLVGRTPPSAADAADIRERLRAANGIPVAVEDHSATLDSRHVPGLTAQPIPVMARTAGAPESVDTREVSTRTLTDLDGLRTVERVMVDGFPVGAFQPYTAGRMLPSSLLADPAFTIVGARRRGHDAGGCLLLTDTDATGVYWVTTLAHHRSRGVGRALMVAALAHVPDLPAVLCATPAGEPLYRSLGFATVGQSRWWR